MVGNKYVTAEFVNLTKHYILEELFQIKQEFGNKYGELLICLDKSADGYWRKDFYSGYKSGRKKGRDESNVDFPAVFKEIDELINQIRENLPWKVLEVSKAEADDIILVLARTFGKVEKVLIHSPDKDMIQAQRETDNVSQFSPLTKKWLIPENKHDHMEDWIMEHVCLGDDSDDVPKVVDHTEFSDNFVKYLKKNGIKTLTPYEFKNSELSPEEKTKLLTSFDIHKVNRKGESTGIKDVYKDIRFGPSTLKKEIKKHGSLDNWLDSHPLYRSHYDRNYILVMEEGIPEEITDKILTNYKEAKADYNNLEFEKYLTKNSLKSILMLLPSVFKINRELTADDFGW